MFMPEHDEKQKPKYGEVEFPPDRVKFYEAGAQKILDAHSRESHEFIRGHEELGREGDKLICLSEGTGYNIILSEDDMPLTSKRDLIFYSNYIGRPHHFGLLLANMEARGVVTPDMVRFSKKASKVLYGGWDLDPNDEFKEVVSIDDNNGQSKEVERTVETVVIFSPKTKTQAAKIADYLLEHADLNKENYIEGSWEVPDIRATIGLAKTLIRRGLDDFRVVVANVHEVKGAKLVVLRQKSRFDKSTSKEWTSPNLTQNEKLARFLVNKDEGIQP